MTPVFSTSAVITGFGTISAAGIGRGYALEPADDAGSPEVFDPVRFLGKKGLRDLDRSSQLLLSAASIALEGARLAVTDDNRHEVGVSVGTTFGSLRSISQFDRSSIVDGPRYVNPSLFPNTVVNAPAGRLAIRFGTRGFNTTISTGFCAGLDALCHAADLLRLSKARAVLVGSVEDMSEEALHYFRSAGRHTGVSSADISRCLESAAVIILEEERFAAVRNAPVMGRILGYGKAAGPTDSHVGYDEGASLSDALGASLLDAERNPSAITSVYVASPADSPPRSRVSEAIGRCFGTITPRPAVHFVDELVGETYSASGLHAVAAALRECRQKKGCTDALVLTTDPNGNTTSVVIGRVSP